MVVIPVRIPQDAVAGEVAVIRLNAASTASPPIQDEAEVAITVKS